MTNVHQFQCDYIAGCHPNVLEALVRTNLVEVPGYGEDPFCQSAADKIRAACGKPEAAVYFFAGGTTTNLTVVAAALRPHQGIMAAETAVLTRSLQAVRGSAPSARSVSTSARRARSSLAKRSAPSAAAFMEFAMIMPASGIRY